MRKIANTLSCFHITLYLKCIVSQKDFKKTIERGVNWEVSMLNEPLIQTLTGFLVINKARLVVLSTVCYSTHITQFRQMTRHGKQHFTQAYFLIWPKFTQWDVCQWKNETDESDHLKSLIKMLQISFVLYSFFSITTQTDKQLWNLAAKTFCWVVLCTTYSMRYICTKHLWYWTKSLGMFQKCIFSYVQIISST